MHTTIFESSKIFAFWNYSSLFGIIETLKKANLLNTLLVKKNYCLQVTSNRFQLAEANLCTFM